MDLDWINQNPKTFIKNLKSDRDLIEVLQLATDQYYNDESQLDDDVYDLLEMELRKRYPDHPLLDEIGAPVRDDIEKVRLPSWMGSLDKIRPGTRELQLWKERHPPPYFVSYKLDGISGLIQYTKTGVGVFTRGDGTVGQDISYLLESLDVPQSLPEEICIRGEFIIKKEVFARKYRKKFPKARSVVSGVINSKKPDGRILRDIDFVAYEIVKSKGEKWSNQFRRMEKLGFQVSPHYVIQQLDESDLRRHYLEEKEESPYEIDGLVISENKPYMRATSGNPKYSVAFKVNLEGVKTTVEYVQWNPSKHGTLKPRVKVKTVELDGDQVNWASGKNAKHIENMGIGPGAVVKMVKSGDVIPEIIEVIKPVKPQFPPKSTWEWNDSHVEIVAVGDEHREEVEINKLLHFFRTFKTPGISIGIITKIYKGGFKTPREIYRMSKSDFSSLPQIRDKMSEKLYESIHQTLDTPHPLETIMAASMIFGSGFGVRKLGPVVEMYPDIMGRWRRMTPEDLKKVEGFSDKSSTAFLEHLPEFIQFMKENPYLKVEKVSEEVSHSGDRMKGEIVVMTGFRDANLEERITEEGGKIGSGVTGKTTLLIVKERGQGKNKERKAEELGIKIVELKNFKL